MTPSGYWQFLLNGFITTPLFDLCDQKRIGLDMQLQMRALQEVHVKLEVSFIILPGQFSGLPKSSRRMTLLLFMWGLILICNEILHALKLWPKWP